MSKVSRILHRKRDTARAERARDVLAAKRAASKRERRQLRRAKASRRKKKGGAEAAAGPADPPRNTDAESPSVRPSPALPVHAGEPSGRPAAREGSRNTALGHCVDSAPAHPYRQPAEPHATPICGKRKQRSTPLARALRLVQAGAPGLQTGVDLVAGVRGAKEAQQARRPAPPVAKVRLLSLPLEPKVDGQVGGCSPGQDTQPAPSSQEGGPAVIVRPDVAVLGQDRGLGVAEGAGTSAAAAAAAVSQRDRGAGRQPGQEPAESRDTSLSSELQPQPQLQTQRHEQGQQGLHESPPCESEAAVCAREAAVAAARLAAINAAAALPPDSPYVRAVMETCSGQATGGQAGQNQLSAHGLLQPQHEQQQRRRRRGLGAVDSEYVACAKHAAAAAAHLAALEAAAALPADSPYLKAAVEVGRGAGFGWPDERDSDVWAQQRALLQQQTARLQRALGAALCGRGGAARYIPAGPVPEGHGAGACSSGAAASLEFRVGSSPGHAEAASGARGAVLAAEAATAEAEAAGGILVPAVVAGGGPAGSGRGGGTDEVRAHHGSAVTTITPGCSVCSRMQASRNGVQAADAPAGTGVGGAAEAPEDAAAVPGAAGQGARVSEWVGSLLLQSPQAESAPPVFQKSKPGAEASGPAAEGRDPSPQVPAAIGCGASSTTHGSGTTSSGNGATTGSSNSGDDSGGSTSSGGSLTGAADSSHSGGSGGDRVRSLSGARRSLHGITDSSRSTSSGGSDQSTSKDVNDAVTSSGGGGLGAGGCGGGAGVVAGDEPSTAVPESLPRPASERSPGRCELTAAAGGGAEAGSAEAGGRAVVPARESQSWAQQLLPEHLPQWEDEVPSDGSSCSDTDGSEFEEGDWEDDDWPGGAAEAKDGSRDKSQHSADKPGASDVTDHMMAAVLSQAAPEHSAGAKRAGGEAAILYADGSDSHGGPDAFVDNDSAAWEAALEAGAGPHESQAEAPQQLAAAVTVSTLALLGHGTGPVQQSRRRLPASGSGPARHDTAGLGAGAVALAEPQLQLPEQFDVNLLAPPVLVPAGTKLQALPPWSVGSPVTSPGLTQAGPGPSAAAGPRVAQVVSGSPYTDAYELPDDGGHPHLGGGAAPQPSSREDGGGVAAGVGAHAGCNAQRGMTAAVIGPGGTRVGAASPPLVLSASGSGGGLATPGRRRGRLVMLHGAGAAACGTPTSQPRAGRAASNTATAGGAGPSAVAAAGPGMGDLGHQGQPLPAEPPGAATRPVGRAGRAPPLSPLRRSSRVPGGQQQQQQQQQQHAAGMAAQGQGPAEPSANGGAGRSRASAGGGMSPSRRAAVRLQRQPVVPSPRLVEDSRLHRSGQQQAVVGVGTAGGSRVGDRARGGSGAGLSAAATGVIKAATASPSRGRTRSKPPERASIAGRGRGGRGRRVTARSHRQSESDQEETADAVRPSDPEEDKEKEGGGQQTRGAPARRRAPRTPSEVLNRLQVSDLRPVLHLPLVEAARQLGLHRTSFMTRCRQLGIARWPAKQLRMLDLMEEQLQELEACGVANHYTAKKCLEEAPGWLAQVAAARSALLENPCGFTMPQPLELLRQRHVKVAWAHRQKYKAALGEEGEEGEEGDDLDSQAQMSQ